MQFKKRNGDAWRHIQATVCILLMVVMLAASFIPLYSVNVEIPQKMQSAVDEIENVLNDPLTSDGETIEIEFPDKLNVNLMLFVKAGTKVSSLQRLYKGMLELAEAKSSADITSYNSAYNDLRRLASNARELITDIDFSNAVALGATLVSAYSQSTVMGIIMMLMLFMTILLPISLFIALIIAVFGLVIHRNNQEKRYMWIMRSFKSAVKAYLLVLAMGLVDSSINFSIGIIIGLLACVCGFVFSAVACRNKEYSDAGHKYLNLIQLVSVVQTVGFFTLYFCVAKSDVIGQYASLIGKRALPYIMSKEYGTPFLSQFMFMLLAFAGIVTMIATLALLPSVLAKSGGLVLRNKDSNIIGSCCSLVFVVILLIATAIEETIVLSALGIILIILALLFSALLIACEVAFIRLYPKYCQGLKETEKYAILTGLDVVETEAYNEEDN